ncbi:hypothetical protein C0992_012984 [Termitomyces sp. T32_za158]|nr:hypothetical protein C0992_012984 [Termitomyces sp. T32_za158]
MEGVKSDALFSYQPPFNILAFLLLKPATYMLSPRALHSFNVFLIKTTSLPILILIGIYERYFAVGMRFAATGRDAAQSFFNSLPRHIKHMPLVEALVGSSSNDIYDAIFDVEVSSDMDPFEGEEDEMPMLRSFYSRDTLNVVAPNSPSTRRRPLPSGASSASIHDSPKPKHNPSLPTETLLSMEGLGASTSVSENNRSPLARLFSARMASADAQIASVKADGTMKRIERMLEDIQSLPVQKLKEEMKDLQVRTFLAVPSVRMLKL